MTTNSQPDEPERPQITIQTGREYQPGSINLLTPEVIAAANITCEDGGSVVVNYASWQTTPPGWEVHQSGLISYGLLVDGPNLIYGYPIKPGTYGIRIQLACEYTDDEGAVSRRGLTWVDADLVITGQPLGTWYEREVLHHVHPTALAARADAHSVKEGLDSLVMRVHGINSRLSDVEVAMANQSA